MSYSNEMAKRCPSSVEVEYGGERHTVGEWARLRGMMCSTLRYRLGSGWGIGAALGYEEHKTAARQSADSAKRYAAFGEEDTLTGWSRRTGLGYNCLYKRIELRGMSVEEAVSSRCHLGRTYLTFDGETKHLSEWARENGVDPDNASERMARGGWDPAEAVGRAAHRSRAERPIRWRGKEMSVRAWARRLGMSQVTFEGRVHRWRKGEITKRAVFENAVGERDYQAKKFCWKGRRYTKGELCEIKGCGKSWFNTRYLGGGMKVSQVMADEKVSAREAAIRSAESNRRNRRRRELAMMGVLV